MEKTTSAGICNKQTCKAYALPISIDKATFPFIANEIAFKNSVVLGTNANTVKPKNLGFSDGNCFKTVSYTHLDVYKRQT